MLVCGRGLVQIWQALAVLNLSVLIDRTDAQVSWEYQSLGNFLTLPCQKLFFLSSACCCLVTISPSQPVEPGHTDGAFITHPRWKMVFQGEQTPWGCRKLCEDPGPSFILDLSSAQPHFCPEGGTQSSVWYLLTRPQITSPVLFAAPVLAYKWFCSPDMTLQATMVYGQGPEILFCNATWNAVSSASA